ncbi:MAG: ATP-binding cassette domain-containing protein [Candidimonas sp.]|uniref:ABC transporter ATP-binding protein n=2 Tax=Pollutimonas thiosulfatoxidans TaxID=2028345 RepID=A0A451FSS2_9BURK|nr:ATP-binding cassette domain-containing protein [Pollutimonas thiosulfatoxidans]MBF6617038.1 ATP-binding cassette domain-containing protein [Candidimonas sp.]QAA95562.1 ABC transporter ATP-binding protein [Pollutimonas thiosulfatoxidans]
MMMRIHVTKSLRAGNREFLLDVHLDASARRIALVGPSGSGKSLTLRAIAGLLRPDAGMVSIGDKVLFDAAQGIALTPRDRRLGYLQQDYGLFPHLTVAQNIEFGLKPGWRNSPRSTVGPAARRWVEAFGLQGVLESYPAEISGGQQQRVALARALAVQPRLLLLDEPLSALDAGLRKAMRAELAAVQMGLDIPSILITHDPEDARVLADRVFEIEDGRIVRESSRDEYALHQSSTPSITLDALKMA